jgi:hypothetical protein
MGRKDNSQVIGELIGTVQAVDRRVGEMKKDMTEGFAGIKSKVHEMMGAHDKRMRLLERWRDGIVGAMALLIALIPIIVLIISKYL